jgi:hypothetical protein
LVILLSLPETAVAASAPALSKTVTQNTNGLQRAVWACEAGAPILARTIPAEIKPRFFLGVADAGAEARGKPPLSLGAGELSGLGQVSTDKGWSNIRFTCGLSPALDRAKTFTFAILSPVAGISTRPSSGAASNGSRRTWQVDNLNPLKLVHTVPETDDQDFRADCVKESGTINVTMMQTVMGLKAGDYVTISISSGARSGLYVGRGVLDKESGAVVPVFTIDRDPLIAWMSAGSSLLVNIDQETVYTISLNGSAAAVRTFEVGCRRAASNRVAS